METCRSSNHLASEGNGKEFLSLDQRVMETCRSSNHYVKLFTILNYVIVYKWMNIYIFNKCCDTRGRVSFTGRPTVNF